MPGGPLLTEVHNTIKESVDPATGSLTFPIYQTSAYRMPEGERFRYSREANPTVSELGRIISVLENAEMTTPFSSGMGAITTTLLTILKPGNTLAITRDCFARTFRFATEFLSRFGINVIVSDPGTENLITASRNADAIFVESISNPILRVYDTQRLSREKPHDCMLIVDSTLATPINQRPIEQGADIVIHSLSKFISGHNDIIGGSASGGSSLIGEIDSLRRTLGTSMDPNTAFLTIRGIKTLGIRIDKINRNAMSIAKMLDQDHRFENVRYPGLSTHPDHNVARRVLNGFGGVVTFDLTSLRAKPSEIFSFLRRIEAANTLGGVNTTISHPATMSHRSLTPEERKLLGFSSRTFRLSVGLEEPGEIFEDIIRLITE